jgi:hypothetical protein
MDPTPDENVFDTSIPFSPYSAIIQQPGRRHLTPQQRRLKALGINFDEPMNHISMANALADTIEEDSEVLIFINASYWQPMASKLKASLTKRGCKVYMVYDVLDNFIHFKDLQPYSELLMRFHEMFMAEADLVTYTANKMLESLVRKNDNLYLPNACNPDNWEVCKYCYAPRSGVVGYFGTMAHWFDTEVLKELVNREEIEEIYLIGPIAEGVNEHFPISGKIRVLGIQDHKAISRLTWNWSCGIIPFIQTPLTDYTDPVKLYEYMSIGMPVVANNLEELEFIRNNIIDWSGDIEEEPTCDDIPADLCFRLADQGNPKAFVDMVVQVAHDNNPAKIAARRRWAATQTWNHRIDKLLDSIPLEWNHE